MMLWIEILEIGCCYSHNICFCTEKAQNGKFLKCKQSLPKELLKEIKLTTLESLFVGRVHIGIVSIIFIIGLSYGLLFYLYNITEQEVRKSISDQQVQSQMEATKSISEHISSDLSLVMNMLDGLANSIYLQKGDLSGAGAKKIWKKI
jgi:hypothetical protein